MTPKQAIADDLAVGNLDATAALLHRQGFPAETCAHIARMGRKINKGRRSKTDAHGFTKHQHRQADACESYAKYRREYPDKDAAQEAANTCRFTPDYVRTLVAKPPPKVRAILRMRRSERND